MLRVVNHIKCSVSRKLLSLTRAARARIVRMRVRYLDHDFFVVRWFTLALPNSRAVIFPVRRGSNAHIYMASIGGWRRTGYMMRRYACVFLLLY